MVAMLRLLVRLPIGWCMEHLFSALAAGQDRNGLDTRRLVGRRGFVRNAVLGAVGIVMAELTVGTYLLFRPNKTGTFGRALTVSKVNVPPVNGAPFRFPPGKFYLVHPEDGVLALYWKCPHLGCTVPWNASEEKFHCPCHGSVYLYNGVRIAGPAPRPMDLMQVTVLPTGDVTVDTGKITTRADYKPEQAVPYLA